MTTKSKNSQDAPRKGRPKADPSLSLKDKAEGFEGNRKSTPAGRAEDVPTKSSKRGPAFLKGRLKEPMDPTLAKASVSVAFDSRLAKQDLVGSRAHARMLAESGLLSPDELASIEAGLDGLAARVAGGGMDWDEGLEDVHMNLEKALTEAIGPVGAKIHTARSRNDQVALDERLYLIELTEGLAVKLRRLRAVLVGRAKMAGKLPMPGYTHLQRAQPILLAHHLMAYYQMFTRDQRRLADLRARIDDMPLGSGALAGTGLPINPFKVIGHLGFVPQDLEDPGAKPKEGTLRPSPNSLDAVASRDLTLEFLAFAAIHAVHLSRLAEEIVLWVSSEFGFASLPDSLSTTSSMMPQKKNPDGAELVRGKAGRVIGNLVALLTVVKGLPLAYNRDLQEDKEPLFDTADTLELVLPLATAMMDGIVFNPERLRQAADDPYIGATDLADHLVTKGLPFREAHAAVGALVAHLAAMKIPLRLCPPSILGQYCPLANLEALQDLDIDSLIANRDTTPGGTAWASVSARIEEAEALLSQGF